MTRFLYAAAESSSQEPKVQFRVLADVTLTTTTARVCTGMHPIAFGTNTYSPIGMLGGLEAVQEDSTPFPRAVRMWLSAVGSAQLSEPLTENLFNKPVKLYRTFLDANNIVVATPELMYSGFVNAVHIKLRDPEKGDHVELEVESRLRREPRSAWFNKETLWQTYSGDTFFNFIEKIPGFKALWGNKATYFDVGARFPRPPGVPGRFPFFGG